jgi:hypothetical protein
MEWNNYVIRRRLDATAWIKSRNIMTKEQFLRALTEIKVDPPSEDVMAELFPAKKEPEVVVLESEPATVPTVETVTAKKSYTKAKKTSY